MKDCLKKYLNKFKYKHKKCYENINNKFTCYLLILI